MEENNEETKVEIKERISFGYVLMDRIISINYSFDHEDKHRLNAALRSLHDNLSPYLDEKQEEDINASMEELKKQRWGGSGHDPENEFFVCAHETFRLLLSIMRDMKLLSKEVRIDTY